MQTAGVRKLKRNGLAARWTGHVVAEDQFGTWIAARTGTRVVWTGVPEEPDSETIATLDIVCLMPRSGWWVAAFWSNGDCTVDITLPPTCVDGLWTFEDLELDLFLTGSGTHGIVDLDEFLVECASGQIRPDERTPALDTAGAMELMLKRGTEPFGSYGWDRFREAVALDLPLTDPPPSSPFL